MPVILPWSCNVLSCFSLKGIERRCTGQEETNKNWCLRMMCSVWYDIAMENCGTHCIWHCDLTWACISLNIRWTSCLSYHWGGNWNIGHVGFSNGVVSSIVFSHLKNGTHPLQSYILSTGYIHQLLPQYASSPWVGPLQGLVYACCNWRPLDSIWCWRPLRATRNCGTSCPTLKYTLSKVS